MKVLFVSAFYEYDFGGAEIVMRALRRGLAERGHDIDVLCIAGGPNAQPGKVWRLPAPPLLRRNPQLLKRILIFLANRAMDRWFIRRALELKLPLSNYDLVHGQDIHSFVLARHLAQLGKAQLGLSVQDNVPRDFDVAGVNPLAAACLRATLRRRDLKLRPLLRDARWITTPSRHIGMKLERFLPPGAGQVVTIYSPHPGHRPVPSQESARNRPPRLLFMGRLSREKGLDLLVDALGDSDVRLTILGLDGPLKAQIAALVRKDARITIRPPVPHREVAPILQAHDIVCCLSMWDDPLPGAVIEGRLYGKAVLATNRGGIPEILQGYPRSVMIDLLRGDSRRPAEVCREGIAKAVEALSAKLDPAEEQAFFDRFSPATFTSQFEALYTKGALAGP